MAKILAELLAGEDMEGGENFCDSIYNALKNHFYGAAAPGSPENGTMYLADDGFTYIYFDSVWYKLVGSTGAGWSKTIGATGDYATWAAMIAEMPDTLAHAITIEMELGTTLTEVCELKNKHSITSAGIITIQAEDYFPQAGNLPTATGSSPTTLIDVGQAWAIDRFIDCWVLIVDGTGTDNGFVKITDSNATSITVAAWPGTQPDATSVYLIVGALIDGGGARNLCFDIANNTARINFLGIGFQDSTDTGVSCQYGFYTTFFYCGWEGNAADGLYFRTMFYAYPRRCGFVNNGNNGIACIACSWVDVENDYFSDNTVYGIFAQYGGMVVAGTNNGDNNGNWGGYCLSSAQIFYGGAECSGAMGNHSDPGTAGNANADQAAGY